MSTSPTHERGPLDRKLSLALEGEVRFSKGDLSLYATDASNYRQIPVGVVIPKVKEDIINTIRICREMKVPVVTRGGGTALAGQSTNEAVVLDMSKYYHRVLEVNAVERWARVQPGIILDELNKTVEKHNLIVGPDPATHMNCTIGGMIGNNACGVHAEWAGKMQENILEMEVLTYQGDIFTVGATSPEELEKILSAKDNRAEIYRKLLQVRKKYEDEIRKRVPKIPRRVSGFNLEELLPENNFNIARFLVGSECTLAVILEAKVKLLEKPNKRSLLVVGYSDIHEVGDEIAEIRKFRPMGLEAVDELLKFYVQEKKMYPEAIRSLPEGHAFLYVEFGGANEEEVESMARECMEDIKNRKAFPESHFKLLMSIEEQQQFWEVRESGLGATARGFFDTTNWPGWEDAAVPPDKVGDYLRSFHGLLEKFDYEASLYGHFGQGCIHCRINFDLKTHEGIEKYHRFIREAAKLVHSYNGSLSGEHGDGQARGELLGIMYGDALVQAMQEVKDAWDPDNRMNPGKVIYANSAIENLRFGESHEVYLPKTHFSFANDKGSFELATERCVGVGKCRRLEGGTMCPSFQVTFEEKHTTRGRAHLLFEMMKKDSLLKPWKEEEVKESLDLCLSCKGCKSDCPVSVDIATYKAEFLSHYYKGRLRPMAAYTMGLIFFWNKLAALIPGLANFFLHKSPFSKILKWLAGIPQERQMPTYARKTFRKIYSEGIEAPEPEQTRGEVILWVDSFNNYFHPDVLFSLFNSLEFAGYKIRPSSKKLCCGRPLYDFGMLNTAKRFLNEIMEDLHEDINKGTPIIFAEPSCLSVFQDELINLFPNDLRARRLNQQCFSLAQFLDQKGIGADLGMNQERNIKVHGHCHYKSLNDMNKDVSFLSQFGEAEKMNTGCCGMAGAFGFEEEKYKVSIDIANNDLIPKIKDENQETLIVADGFSCREQVKQILGNYPAHSAQVMWEGIKRAKRKLH